MPSLQAAMSAIRALTFSVVCATALAQPQENGLFEISDEETATPVYSEDGDRYWLADKLDVALDENSVFSLNNINDRFQVTLRYASDALPEVFSAQDLLSSDFLSSRLALLVDGMTLISDGVGGGNGQVTVFFHLSGAESAERVAEHFGTEVQYRYHPGHQISVRFAPEEQTVKLGDRVLVTLEISNIGQDAFTFSNGATLPFRFSARRLSGDAVQHNIFPLRANGMSSFSTLRPGETATIGANVANWIEFDQPDLYYVFGSYRMRFLGAGLPIGPRTIWSEYVSGDFTVTVEP